MDWSDVCEMSTPTRHQKAGIDARRHPKLSCLAWHHSAWWSIENLQGQCRHNLRPTQAKETRAPQSLLRLGRYSSQTKVKVYTKRASRNDQEKVPSKFSSTAAAKTTSRENSWAGSSKDFNTFDSTERWGNALNCCIPDRAIATWQGNGQEGTGACQRKSKKHKH